MKIVKDFVLCLQKNNVELFIIICIESIKKSTDNIRYIRGEGFQQNNYPIWAYLALIDLLISWFAY